MGKKIRTGGSTGPWIEIVGVVGSIKHRNLEETPRPELYISYRQGPPVSPFLAIKTAGDPAAMVQSVRQVIREAGADPPTDVRTMEQIRSSSVGERRFVLLLVGLFGGVTLVLAGLGVYGVITLIAAERTAEVGIRLALGASPMQVLSLVIGHAVRLAAIGIALGTMAALALTPLLAWQLFGIGATDPVTYGTVALTLAFTAACAALVPARRAMRIDPATTLKRRDRGAGYRQKAEGRSLYALSALVPDRCLDDRQRPWTSRRNSAQSTFICSTKSCADGLPRAIASSTPDAGPAGISRIC